MGEEFGLEYIKSFEVEVATRGVEAFREGPHPWPRRPLNPEDTK